MGDIFYQENFKTIVKLFFILLCHLTFIIASSPELFPYSTQDGSSQYIYTDDSSANHRLGGFEFKFFNRNYDSVFISSNGNLAFGQGITDTYSNECRPSHIPIIMVYWADVGAPTSNSGIYYRLTANATLLQRASNEVFRAFPKLNGSLKWLFIVTWENVQGYIDQDKTNTYQAVLTTDGRRSFVILLYKKITYPSKNVTTAGAGFKFGDGVNVYKIPGACTPSITTSIAKNSNVFSPGKWIFQVDSSVGIPTNDCFEENANRDNLILHQEYFTLMGKGPLLMQHKCFSSEASAQVTCSFGSGPVIVGKIITITNTNWDIYALCDIPLFYSIGQVALNVTFEIPNKQIKLSFKQYVNVLRESDLNVEGKISVQMSSNDVLQVSAKWNPMFLEMDDLESLYRLQQIRETTTLRLLEYNGSNWQDLGTLHTLSSTAIRNGVETVNLRSHPLMNRTRSVLKIVAIHREIFLGSGISVSKQLVSSIDQALDYTHIAFKEHSTTNWIVNGRNEYDDKCEESFGNQLNLTVTDILPCPISVDLAGVDWRFMEVENIGQTLSNPGAYRVFIQSVPTTSGAGSQCAYHKSGALMIGPPGGSRVHLTSPNKITNNLEHYWNDVLPYMYCCKWSVQNETNCRKYFKLRTINSASKYSPPKFSLLAGTGHITTFDGISYRFNGFGEFTAINSVDSSFTHQIRMELFWGTTNISLVTAAVWQQTIDRQLTKVQVSIDINHHIVVNANDNAVTVSNANMAVSGIKIYLSACMIRFHSNSEAIISFANGLAFQVTAMKNDMRVLSINIIAATTKEWENKLVGLFGKFDNYGDNDLTLPNGTYLTPAYNMNSLRVYNDFGLKWITERSTSIFKYKQGESFDSYHYPSREPWFLELSNLKSIRQSTTLSCYGILDCVLDFLATGNMPVAVETRDTILDFKKLVKVTSSDVQQCMIPEWVPEGAYFKGYNYHVGSFIEIFCENGLQLFASKGPLETKFVCVENGNESKWEPVTQLNSDPNALMCLTEDEINYEMQNSLEVKVDPNVVPVFGNIPIFVYGPAIHDIPSNISCDFTEATNTFPTKTKGQIVFRDMNGKSQILCMVPFLNSLGTVILDVILSFGNKPPIILRNHIYAVKETEYYAETHSLSKQNFTSNMAAKIVLISFDGRKWQEIENITSFIKYTENDDLTIINGTELLGKLRGGRDDLISLAVKTEELVSGTEIKYTSLVPMDDVVTTMEKFRNPLENSSSNSNTLCKQRSTNESPQLADPEYMQCPQTVAQVEIDWRFMKTTKQYYGNSTILNPNVNAVYIQEVPTSSGKGTECAYDSNGNQIFGPPEGSRHFHYSPNSRRNYWLHYSNDVLPYMQCCRWSVNEKENCREYFYNHEIASSNKYISPSYAAIIGAGHLINFEGHSFTISESEGEVWLIDSSKGSYGLNSFKMQTRLMQYLETNATVVTAIVAEDYRNGKRAKAQISVNPTSSLLDIELNGNALSLNTPLNKFTIYEDGVTLSFRSRHEVIVTFSSGFSVNVTTSDVNGTGSWMSIIVLAERNLGNMKGLLYNSSSGGNVSIESVSIDESIFSYSIGKSYKSYNRNPTLKTTDLNLTSQWSGGVHQTYLICGSDNACIYDFLVTGSTTFASLTKATNALFERFRKVASTETIECNFPDIPNDAFIQGSSRAVDAVIKIRCENNLNLFTTQGGNLNGTYKCIQLESRNGPQWLEIDTNKTIPSPMYCLTTQEIDEMLKHTEDLKVYPTVISVLGNVPLLISGPKLEEWPNYVTCVFRDMDHTNPIKTNGSVLSIQGSFTLCPVPFLSSLGRIYLEVQFSFSFRPVSLYKGSFFAVSDLNYNNQSSLQITLTKEGSPKTDDESLLLSASRNSHLNSDISDVLQKEEISIRERMIELVLYGFDGKTWSDEIVVAKAGNVSSMEINITRLKLYDAIEQLNTHPSLAFGVKKKYVTSSGVTISEVAFQKMEDTMTLLQYKLVDNKIDAINEEDVEENEFQKECRNWYNYEPDILPDSLSCPVNIEQAKIDWRFLEKKDDNDNKMEDNIGSFFIQTVPSPSGAGVNCVYDLSGNLVIGKSEASHVQRHSPNDWKNPWSNYWNDISPYMHCCKWSMSSKSCKNYFVKRPIENGAKYIPPKFAKVNGAGQVTSFHETSYRFNPVCEFLALRYEEIENAKLFRQKKYKRMFTAQIRMEQFVLASGKPTNTSVTTAIVMQDEYSYRKLVKVQVQNEQNILGILVNEERVQMFPDSIFPDGTTLTFDGAILRFSNHASEILVTFSTGFSFRISLASDTEMGLNIICSATSDRIKRSVGLLALETLEADITGASSIDAVREWIFPENQSLFSYPPGKSYADYFRPEFNPPSLSPQDILNLPITNVVGFCSKVDECLFAFLASGSESIANSTRDIYVEFSDLIKSTEKSVEICKDPVIPENGYMVSIWSYGIGSVLEISCEEGFVMAGEMEDFIEDGNFTCTKSGQDIEWLTQPELGGGRLLMVKCLSFSEIETSTVVDEMSYSASPTEESNELYKRKLDYGTLLVSIIGIMGVVIIALTVVHIRYRWATRRNAQFMTSSSNLEMEPLNF